ncbi:uncharacterized protein LOC119403503 [Rhipicephalus sanguineus]|uniref:uncharacterized protein LOC119403503 n=1 Tax=Rhipicephalus sanguineus TaxID=34632 RepID=UPI0020C406A4|nr:uncharacterized protein LOC119403503 [Rhipicephalus sanguineus]
MSQQGTLSSHETPQRKATPRFTEGEKSVLIFYPSRKFYQKAGSVLIQTYPQLRDPCGSGHDSWVVMIRQKFKNERRKLSSSRVTESRQKFGAAAKRPATSAEKNLTKKGKVGQKLAQDLPPCCEDLASIAAHEAWLLAEMGKPLPDIEQIRCRLELSHSSRIKQLSQIPFAAALERYPYLMDIEWFLHDFNSLIKKDGEKAIEHGFSQVMGLAVGGALGARKKDVGPLLEVFDPAMSPRRKKHIQTVRTLCLLARLLNQPTSVEALFVPMEQDKPQTPCIIYSGSSAEEAVDMFLSVEGVKMTRVIDATQGITAIMAAYWLFDVSYAPLTQNVCCLFEHLFLDITVTKPKCVVQRFIATQKMAVFPAAMDV